MHVSARLPRKLRNLALSNSLIDCQLQIMYTSKRCSKIWNESGISLQSLIFVGFHVESVATFLATTEESTQIEEVTKTSQVIYNSYSKWCFVEIGIPMKLGGSDTLQRYFGTPKKWIKMYHACRIYLCIVFVYIFM